MFAFVVWCGGAQAKVCQRPKPPSSHTLSFDTLGTLGVNSGSGVAFSSVKSRATMVIALIQGTCSATTYKYPNEP